MCGITGIVTKNTTSKENNTQLLRQLSECIAHRGPDDYAEYVDQNCGIAIRRLAILDLTPGIYPFVSQDRSKYLVFNGEIYNFWELRRELESYGYSFNTNCDAEMILLGFEKWGNDFFIKLRGMFAIALWDTQEHKLTLVRDRIGIKPLYYINTKNIFAFSSEAKALYTLPENLFSSELDYTNLSLLLGFMFLPKSSETLVKDIKKLEPATILEVTEHNLKFTKYWDIGKTDQTNVLTFSDAVKHTEAILIESIKIHLLSDVPLGLMLSGGIDSALIAAIIQKYKLTDYLNTYTAKFDHKFNESTLAKQTAEYLKTTHHELFIDTKDINKNIERHIGAFDDLTTFDGGLITTKLICEEIKKTGTKVLLLGEGADELFGGYSWFGLSQYPLALLPGFVREAVYYYAISRNITVNFNKYAKFWKLSKNSDIFTQVSHKELTEQLPNHLLMKVDKGSMAASLEARVPYLDHKLVEYVYSLPQEYKLKGHWYKSNVANEKYILREIAKKYLPEEVVNRKKRGFMLPMSNVLTDNITKVKDYVLSNDAVSNKVLSLKQKETMFNKSKISPINMQNEYFLWRLFILEVWAKSYSLK